MHKLKLSIATGAAIGFLESLVTLPNVDPTGWAQVVLPLILGGVLVFALRFDLWEVAGQAVASGISWVIFFLLWWGLGAFKLVAATPIYIPGLLLGTFFFGFALTLAGGLIGFAFTLKRRR